VPLALEDPYSDPRFQYVPESGVGQFRSLVAAPIMDEDRCLGVIFVLSSSVWNATSSDIMLLTTTANQVSGVIRNAQLFQNIQERLSELSTIYEIGKALTSTLDVDQLLSLIAKNSTQALRAKSCAIRLLNRPGKNVLYTTLSPGPADDAVREMDARIGELVAAQLLRERKPLLVDMALTPVPRCARPDCGSSSAFSLSFTIR
jgi:GAF domain-containing protein